MRTPSKDGPRRAKPSGERPTKSKPQHDRQRRSNPKFPESRGELVGERASDKRWTSRTKVKVRPKRPPSDAPAATAAVPARPFRPRGPQPVGAPTETMRIAKALARAGLCSRRDGEAWIAEGRVKVNGTTITSPALNVTPRDRIEVDGEPMPDAEPVRLWRYHKPRGLVTTHKDPEGRPTVFEKMPKDMPRVISIGRLDFNTEGLLLLTNDGELARYLELPNTGWLRRYRVRAHGSVTQQRLDSLKDGVEIDGVRYGPIEATLDTVQGANVWLTVGLREGKNREVRNILTTLDLVVNRLIRVSYGPFQLLDLEPGDVESIKRRVLADQLGPELAEQFGLLVDRERVPAAPSKGKSRKLPRHADDD
jgi:23S rRNA pseudouridine2605 synthase